MALLALAALLVFARPTLLEAAPSLFGGKVPVWVWYDFPEPGAPHFYKLNRQTWEHHLGDKFELHLLNKKNIRDYIPDVAPEFFKLYDAAKSDYIRAAMISRHGGVYLDGDMVLMHNLEAVYRDLLEGQADYMPYMTPRQTTITTNFLAGAKGNKLSAAHFANITKQLKQQCTGPEGKPNEQVCCYNSSGSIMDECHVGFGAMACRLAYSLMSLPENSGVRVKPVPAHMGFQAAETGQFLFSPLLTKPPAAADLNRVWKEGNTHETEVCWREDDDLVCTQQGRLQGFFMRHGHHLFNSINGGYFHLPPIKGTVIAEVYRLALDRAPVTSPPNAAVVQATMGTPAALQEGSQYYHETARARRLRYERNLQRLREQWDAEVSPRTLRGSR